MTSLTRTPDIEVKAIRRVGRAVVIEDFLGQIVHPVPVRYAEEAGKHGVHLAGRGKDTSFTGAAVLDRVTGNTEVHRPQAQAGLADLDLCTR